MCDMLSDIRCSAFGDRSWVYTYKNPETLMAHAFGDIPGTFSTVCILYIILTKFSKYYI